MKGPGVEFYLQQAASDFERELLLRHARPGYDLAQSKGQDLISAIEDGHLAVVRFLLECGADPNWPPGADDPERPVAVALHMDEPAILQALLDAGAEVYDDDEDDATADTRPVLQAHFAQHLAHRLPDAAARQPRARL